MSETNEVRVIVEYVLDLPQDIQINHMDAFINNTLDEGSDAESIKSRIITNVDIVERSDMAGSNKDMFQALEVVETLSNPENTGAVDLDEINEVMKKIHEISSGTLNDMDNEEDGDLGQ